MKPQKIQGLLAIAALGASLMLPACATNPYEKDSSDSPDTAEAEAVVGKPAWLANVSNNLSRDLCSPDEVFLSCYELSAADCSTRARDAAVDCEQKISASIPESVNNEAGQRLGAQIGRCTGESLFSSLNLTTPYQETEQCRKVLGNL